MKHFALCLNDKYVTYACVTIQSILMHHRKENVTFHLVTDGFTERKKSGMNIFHILQSSIMQVVLHGREIRTIIHFTIIGGRLSMPCRLIFGM